MSDDKTFIENEVDTADNVGVVAQMNESRKEVTVADVDDMLVPNSRPRRNNTGKGVERLQMDFHGKGCQSKRECNFVTNSASIEAKGEAGNIADSYMKLACNVIFTQIAAKRGFKQHDAKAIAAMINEFAQLNEGAVSGKPAVVPTDSNSLTITEKRKALRAVNIIKEKWNGDIKG